MNSKKLSGVKKKRLVKESITLNRGEIKGVE